MNHVFLFLFFLVQQNQCWGLGGVGEGYITIPVLILKKHLCHALNLTL